MNRRRLCLGAATVALSLPLAGCMTVHGERAVIPSVRAADAARILAHFADVNNAASKAYDARLIGGVETGALAATDAAGLRAQHANHPAGNPAFSPLKFSDAKYVIPEQRGWPKFFVADTATNRSSTARWLLVFRRDTAAATWKAAFVAAVPTAQMPRFATGKDGYAEPLPPSGTDLVVQPGQVASEYTDYLQKGLTGRQVFAAGPATSGVRDSRKTTAHTANSVTQYADQPAEGPDYTPIALRTDDGGALVFFASHHQSRATYRAGFKLNIDPDTKALMTGTPKTSVTLSHMSQQAVTVPPADAKPAQVVFLSRVVGLVSAKGA
jgi:hypothetical protein